MRKPTNIKDIDIKTTKDRLVKFIEDTVKGAGFNKVIMGLSGGVDSASVAYLSTEALGAENVIAAILPYDNIGPDGIKFADIVINKLKLKKYIIDIAPMVDAYFKSFPDADRIRRGNKMARERMTILYDLSKKENALVIGSGNKTEVLLGYCTLYGDSACALNPLASLYKTQIYILAKHLGVPEEIIKRIPTAGLWADQTDEGELGCSYSDVDRLLSLMVDAKFTDIQLEKEGFNNEFIKNIRKKIKASKFKRKPAIIPGE
jgi:NAD+ synthase